VSQSQHAESLFGAAAKLTPPAGVVAASAAGINWQTIVWQLTAVYTVLMIAKLIWDWLLKPLWWERRKK